jgi:hypothetical protein
VFPSIILLKTAPVIPTDAARLLINERAFMEKRLTGAKVQQSERKTLGEAWKVAA